jgi:hypothetical protein
MLGASRINCRKNLFTVIRRIQSSIVTSSELSRVVSLGDRDK